MSVNRHVRCGQYLFFLLLDWGCVGTYSLVDRGISSILPSLVSGMPMSGQIFQSSKCRLGEPTETSNGFPDCHAADVYATSIWVIQSRETILLPS